MHQRFCASVTLIAYATFVASCSAGTHSTFTPGTSAGPLQPARKSGAVRPEAVPSWSWIGNHTPDELRVSNSRNSICILRLPIPQSLAPGSTGTIYFEKDESTRDHCWDSNGVLGVILNTHSGHAYVEYLVNTLGTYNILLHRSKELCLFAHWFVYFHVSVSQRGPHSVCMNPGLLVSPLASSNAACGAVHGVWHFGGSCAQVALTRRGAKIALPAYRGYTTTLTIGKNHVRGSAAIIVAEATGNGDVHGSFEGVPLLPYANRNCVTDAARRQRQQRCPGKAFLYVQILNVSENGDITLAATPAIAVSSTVGFPGRGRCFPAALNNNGWVPAIPYGAKPTGTTLMVASHSDHFDLEQGPTVLALACQ